MAYSAELYVHDLDRQAADALNQFPKFVKLLESYSANYDEKAAKIDLLCNGTQYRKRQRKAMGKPPYYQKVINSQPPLIFVYGVARFELLRRLPPTTTV